MIGYLNPRKPLVLMMAVAATIAILLAVWATAASAADTVVYTEDFEGGAPDLSKWSSTGAAPAKSTTPTGRGFLGTTVFTGTENLGFSNETVSLSLTGLAAHSNITVSFDGYFIRSWDGNGDHGFGGELFALNADGGSPLLNTNFANVGINAGTGLPFTTQAFPASIPPGASNPEGTGAAEQDTLGYGFFGDSVYNLCFTFSHTATTLVVDFTGSGLQSRSDESWGLDNVVVETDSGCVVLEVEIDIKPGSDPNCFNSNDHGVIPVAILGSASFDASNVDPFRVELDGQDVRVKGKSGNAGSLEDVNGDGFLDLVVQIIDDAAYVPGNTIGTITGHLNDGTPFIGTDSICITQ